MHALRVFAALSAAAVLAVWSGPAAAQSAITGYGLILSYGFGYGGMVIAKYEPAVLFTSGDILLDVEAMAEPQALDSDKQAHPDHWSQWRRTGATYEYRTKSGKWNQVAGNKVWATPPVAKLSGAFEHVGGGGNLAFGGTSAVFTQSTYNFQPGGRVVRRGLASAGSEVEGGGSTTRTTTASHGEQVGATA